MSSSIVQATPMTEEMARRIEQVLAFLLALVSSIQTTTPPPVFSFTPDWMAPTPDSPDVTG